VTIVEFLTARLGEEEAAANAATPGPWKTDDPLMSDFVGSQPGKHYVADCSVGTGYRSGSIQDADHIARHDPARVLREVVAGRRVLERHRVATGDDLGVRTGSCYGCGTTGEFSDPRTRKIDDCPELRDLAAPYADHPDYDPAWTCS